MRKIQRVGTLSTPIYWNEEENAVSLYNNQPVTFINANGEQETQIPAYREHYPVEDNGRYEVDISLTPLDIGRTSAYMGKTNFSLEVMDVETEEIYYITKSNIPKFFSLMRESSINGVVRIVAVLGARRVLNQKRVFED